MDAAFWTLSTFKIIFTILLLGAKSNGKGKYRVLRRLELSAVREHKQNKSLQLERNEMQFIYSAKASR